MPKNTCSCNDDSQKEYINEAKTFRTHLHLDNTFIPVFQNPVRQLRKLVSETGNVLLVDRVNCNSCDDSITTQEKLKVRKKDRPTPYRVPYNHFRKVTSCKEDCTTNVKIIKDLSCSDIPCPVTNYAISRLVDKNGVRNLNNGGNYKNYLQSSGKTYYLNTAGILPENAVPGKIHTYKIGALENTLFNYNSQTQYNKDCRLNYSSSTSLTEKSFTLSKINTTTKKYSNPKYQTSGSVSSKAHIHRKKFKNIIAGQLIGKDGYNNCRNGGLCSIYMQPGPNTKLFMGKTAIQRCIPPRIRGIKQTCPVPPPGCENNKFINPKFERNEYTETFDNNGYLKITIDHCKLNTGDIINIKFLGYSTTVQSIFTPITKTSAVGAVVSSITNDDSGSINLNITEIFVNRNTIYWIMPQDVGEGRTTIILNDGGNDSIVNSTNGPDGLIYATVKIPRHISSVSRPAWTITPIDPCYYRQLNGTGAITSYTATGAAFLPLGSFVNASVPYGGTIHNPEDLLMLFTLSNEDFQSGDVLIIEFYTSSSFGTGFFNTTNYPSGISNWNLNPTPVEGQEFNPASTIPTLLLAKADISDDPYDPDFSYNANYFSSASWSGTSQIYIGSNIYYKQTLSITIGSSPPDTTSSNEVYYLYLVRAEQTVEGSTTYTNLFSNHPTSAGDVKFQISCNCYTGTGISNGYNFGGPCSGIAVNASFTVNNANEGMSLADFDNSNDPVITAIETYTPDLDPDIVKFTFSLNNQSLTKGDVIVFRITTDYGDNESGFFTNYGVTNGDDGPTWELNKRPAYNDYSFISMWLEQNGTVYFENVPAETVDGIESINFANHSYNTNTNVYSQFLYVTIGKNITSISNSEGSLTLGIYANNDIITSFPTTAYNISYEIDSYCWATTGNKSDISYDPCAGRNGSFTNTSMTLAGNTATYPPYQTVTPSANLSHFIVLFTFTLFNDSLIDGDVLQFLIKTDYGDSSSGFFLDEIDNDDWIKNAQPSDTVAINSPSIWLQDPSDNLISGAIESAQVTNTSLNTNDYRQTLSVTINTSSNISGTVVLGIFDQSHDYLASHPSTTYDVDYQISANCWTSTALLNGYSFDPCSGRSNCSLTNSSLTVTGFDSTTAGTITGGDYIELAEVAFTASGAGLLGGDILLLKLIIDYEDNSSDGFWASDVFSYNGVTFNQKLASGMCCWFTQGNSTTPVSGMIQSITLTSTESGTPVDTWTQVMSITLAGTSITTYGSAGTNWKFNMQGLDDVDVLNITQTSYLTAGSIDYELDLNCFTGTGEQEGVDWLANPCYGRGTGQVYGISVTTYPTTLVGGGDELEYQIIQIQNYNDTVRGGDVITIKFRTTYNSFFTGSMSNSDWYKNNDNPTSNDKPRVYLSLFDSQTNTTTTLNAISTATTSAAVQDGNKWIQTVTLKLISGSTIYAPAGSNLMIYIGADNLTNTSSYITQPSANTGGTVEHEVDINCFTNTSADFDSQNLVYSYGIAGSLTSLSLLPNNFEGFQRTYDSNGLGQNVDTQDRQKPFYDLKNTQGRNGQTGSSNTENLQFYTNSEIAADLNLRNITSRFTISNALASGSSIKITFWKENDTSINSWDRSFFNSGAVGTNTTASEPFTLTGGYSSSENLYIEGKYNTGGNDTVFTFSSYTISSYSGNEQSITLTTAANIPANANIKIIFHDHFGDALCSNPREGRGIYYDLEVTSASTSGIPVVYTKQEDNLGWYSQDISANFMNSTGTVYPPSASGELYIFSNDLSQPSILTYRHHNAIPSGSKIRLTWSAQTDPFSPDGTYNFFKGHGTTTENLISNTSNPSTGNVGIEVKSHTTLNSTSGTNVSISDFTLGTLVASYNEDEDNTVSDNHGSVEYIEFEIDNNIAGEPVSKVTNAATRFIEIKVYGGHNLRPAGSFQGPSWYAAMDHRVSIEVRNSDNILIGSIYNVFYYTKP